MVAGLVAEVYTANLLFVVRCLTESVFRLLQRWEELTWFYVELTILVFDSGTSAQGKPAR